MGTREGLSGGKIGLGRVLLCVCVFQSMYVVSVCLVIGDSDSGMSAVGDYMMCLGELCVLSIDCIWVGDDVLVSL